jgi:hypothetical protein
MLTVRAEVLVEIVVEVPGFETTITDRDVAQAVQDEIGHTGAKVVEVDGWTPEVDE